MNELSYLKQQLQALIQNREIRINGGQVESIEVYRQIVGERTGLLLAIYEIEDLLKKQNEADNVG
jgi:hypothetical protein